MFAIRPGRPDPLGATVTDDGVDFAVFAGHADRVELCLFSEGEEQRLDLPACARGIWHGHVPGARPGLAYGYRVHGPWRPAAGLRHDPSKLLLDPYARAVRGPIRHDVSPLGVVKEPLGPAPAGPRVPWAETVIYEAHVKGLTQTHPGVPEPLRGTYGGLAHPAITDHLRGLGITTVELLPVHLSVSEERLTALGLVNYWGYGTLGFFAADPRFARDPERAPEELRAMVQGLHAAGLEVILDVVYNHTIEGAADGPTLSLRGLDNQAYYRLDPRAPARYVDWTGCGNTLDLRHPATLRLVLDSMRYWVGVIGVDGFRFDLAPALLRHSDHVDPVGRFVAAVAQDPLLAGVKLIAEPWDLGPDGYALGRFPAPWAEWNDRFRDTARHVWRGDAAHAPDLASRLAGSADLFGSVGSDRSRARGPLASINFVACHDGFTLADLTAWTDKRNEANGEANRDGTDNNVACNWGVEGPTDRADVLLLRGRAQRNLLSTAIFAQGVPMIGHGDELGRSQGGNNNAYCQDSAVSWIDWSRADPELLAFVAHALALRAGNAVFRRPQHFTSLDDAVTWLRLDGAPMGGDDWVRGKAGLAGFGMLLAADAATDDHARGALLLLNASPRDRDAILPAGAGWRCRLDTARPALRDERVGGERQVLVSWSLQLLEVG